MLWGIIRHGALTLLLSPASQFLTRKNFKMDGRRLRWGGERFSCSITSCVRPSTTNIQSELMRRPIRAVLFLERDLMAVTLLICRAKILFLLKLLADNIPGIGLVARECSFTLHQQWFSDPKMFIWFLWRLEFVFPMCNNCICTMHLTCPIYFSSFLF